MCTFHRMIAAIAGISAIGIAAITFAQTNQQAVVVDHPKKEKVIEIGPHGRALIRGKIASVATSTLGVESWGGVWTIHVQSGAEIIPKNPSGSGISHFDVGDFVGLRGTVATSTPWTINANLVRDWTERRAMQLEKKEIKKEVREEMKELKREAKEELKELKREQKEAIKEFKTNLPRFFEGSVSATASSSLTLTHSSTTSYTVEPTASTKIFNRNYSLINWSNILVGHRLMVFGHASNSLIKAITIRDITLP